MKSLSKVKNLSFENATPLAIFFGFLLVALAIYFEGLPISAKGQHFNSDNDKEIGRRDLASKNLYGNPKAKTSIVEFSDFECPFCSRVHPVIKKIVDESDGQINWEFRHLPLPSHKNAQIAAEASECVARLADNEAFWNYSQKLFDNQTNINQTNLENFALEFGVSKNDLTNCMSSSEIKNQVSRDADIARKLGGTGTPFSMIVREDGTTQPVSGALPHNQWMPLLKPN
jgi:protein-disulfide isomerase